MNKYFTLNRRKAQTKEFLLSPMLEDILITTLIHPYHLYICYDILTISIFVMISLPSLYLLLYPYHLYICYYILTISIFVMISLPSLYLL